MDKYYFDLFSLAFFMRFADSILPFVQCAPVRSLFPNKQKANLTFVHALSLLLLGNRLKCRHQSSERCAVPLNFHFVLYIFIPCLHFLVRYLFHTPLEIKNFPHSLSKTLFRKKNLLLMQLCICGKWFLMLGDQFFVR